ncbi:MAG: hypothetical protein H5T61_09155 [Thermoflexales bacterium]|nr:hypothetical protein [Thermoflexales bacterium]
MDHSLEILKAIVQAGREHQAGPPLSEVEIFQDWSDRPETWDRRDGSCTRRELLARYLLVNAVLDQGPDTEGVRLLLTRVTNELYRREIRFLHEPHRFFQELGIAIQQIDSVHDAIKHLRAEEWARRNQSQPSKYSLFMENAAQVLGYAVFRWGVPLALPLILVSEASEEERPQALLNYLRTYPSAERMSEQLKSHRRYGLGKAIGDKAAHLYAKWLIHSYPILRDDHNPGWGAFSFEVPFDSNAGRVLWRTGFFLEWADYQDYESWSVVQTGKGKGGTHYIRVTNIREKASQRAQDIPQLWQAYRDIVTHHLRMGRPQKVQIQRIPLALLYMSEIGTPGELDDGLMYIGTQFCFNHDRPECEECPAQNVCRGYQEERSLITWYRT